MAIKRMVPDTAWDKIESFPQLGIMKLAKLTHATLYGSTESDQTELRIRDEYLAWVMEDGRSLNYVDHYGVTFDCLVPLDDPDPEVMFINIIELEVQEGYFSGGEQFANGLLPFSIDKSDYVGKKLLAVLRCCQLRKGATDRELVNGSVAEKDMRLANGTDHLHL